MDTTATPTLKSQSTKTHPQHSTQTTSPSLHVNRSDALTSLCMQMRSTTSRTRQGVERPRKIPPPHQIRSRTPGDLQPPRARGTETLEAAGAGTGSKGSFPDGARERAKVAVLGCIRNTGWKYLELHTAYILYNDAFCNTPAKP